MFDEISLETGINVNSKNGCVDRFVDFGGSQRSLAFADHALVFLLKILEKKNGKSNTAPSQGN